MADYPDPNQPPPANPGQQPWPSGSQPAQGGYTRPSGSQPQSLYGNAVPPSMAYGYHGVPAQSAPYPLVSPQPWQPVQRPVRNVRPFVLALLAFPFLSLKMFVWPGPATFAKEKDRVGGSAIFFLLLVGAAITGVLAYLWGRVARLTPGIENLSAGRVVPQPLSAAVYAGLAVGVPLLFLFLECMLYWMAKKRGGQRSSLRAQLYTGLLIEAPLFAFLVALALVLLYRPDLGSSARLLFAAVAGAFLLYSLLLHVFAVMAVHRVGAGKAMLCVVLTVVILAVVVVALMAVGENADNRNESSSRTSGRGQKGGSPRDGSSDGGELERDAFRDVAEGDGRRDSARGSRLLCPNCGQQLPAIVGQPGFPCPRCGAPMMYR